RIYKEELKLESESIYGIQQCYVEKLPYKVLIASHIKACGTCLREQDEEQAYDVNNGLLLSPNIDSYFDKYDISFDEEGKIMFGVRVHQKIRDRYVDFSLDKTVLNKKRLWYLDKHRKLFEKKQKALKKNS
ncbi:MAG: HNH endonuclease, partial [Lachnospiraceae bacterium]|nr:HNH endonuclease [Lachnospiraceae bacterium]